MCRKRMSFEDDNLVNDVIDRLCKSTDFTLSYTIFFAVKNSIEFEHSFFTVETRSSYEINATCFYFVSTAVAMATAKWWCIMVVSLYSDIL